MDKEQCILCQARIGFNTRFTINSDRSEFKKYHFRYKECKSCGFGILDPYIPQEIASVYKPEYFVELGQPVSSKLFDKLLRIQFHEGYIAFVNHFVKKGKVLDIGCGNGEFLQIAQKNGFEIAGVDPYSNKKVPYIKKGQSEKIPYDAKSFDIVTMWHVFEHVVDIQKSLSEISRVLKDTGYFIFEVPNANSLSFHLFKDNYAWKMVPEHSLYFSEKSIRLILKKSNFSIQRIEYPMKANLNFAFSIKRAIHIPFLSTIIFIMILPISLVISYLGQYLKNGEVIRVAAKKVSR